MTESMPSLILHQSRSLYLRRTAPSDAGLLFHQGFSQREFMRLFRLNDLPQSEAEVYQALLQRAQISPDQSGYLELLIVHKRHGPIGVAALAGYVPLHRRAEYLIGLFDQTHRGVGLGLEATLMVMDLSFNAYGLHKVYACTYSYNHSAQQGLESVGFSLEGKRKDFLFDQVADCFVDLYEYGLTVDEFRAYQRIVPLSKRLLGRDITQVLTSAAVPAKPPTDALAADVSAAETSPEPATSPEPVTLPEPPKLPRVSIVMPVYNQERYLDQAIASVLQQTYTDFELIVWDDGSTDRSLEIAHAFAAQDDRVRVMTGQHGGAAAALQGGFAAARGTYLGQVDSDDGLAPQALEKTIAVLEANPAVGMVYTQHWLVDAQGQVTGLGECCTIPYSPDRLLIDFMTFHFRIIRRSVYQQVGGIRLAYDSIEDYDLCLRLSEITEIHHLPEPLYFYRKHASSTCNTRGIEQLYKCQKAVNEAIWRRGLADRRQLRIEFTANFYLDDIEAAPYQTSKVEVNQGIQQPLVQWAEVVHPAMPAEPQTNAETPSTSVAGIAV